MNKTLVYNYNIFYLFVIVVWPVIRANYITVDGAGRINIFFTILAVLINGGQLFRVHHAMKMWVLWIFYNIINTYFKGYGLSDYPYHLWALNSYLIPLVTFFVVYQMALRSYKELIKYLLVFFSMYMLLGVTNLTMEDTMSGTRYGNNLGNSFFNNVIVIMPIVSLFYGISKKDKSVIVYTIAGLLMFFVLLSGHRKGLIAAAVMIGGYFYARIAKKTGVNIKSFILLMGLFVVVYLVSPYILGSTNAGARIESGMEEAEFQDSFFLKMVGNRALMYVEGFAIFLEHPITGIGITNFINADYSLGEGHILHTEYMVELTECGIIGSALFLAFFISMIYRAVKMVFSHQCCYEGIIFITSLLSIILINFTASCHDEPLYFLLFGLLFAQYEKYKEAIGVKKQIKNENFIRRRLRA